MLEPRVALLAVAAVALLACGDDTSSSGAGTGAGGGDGGSTSSSTTTDASSGGGSSTGTDGGTSTGSGGAPPVEPGDILWSYGFSSPTTGTSVWDLAALSDGTALATRGIPEMWDTLLAIDEGALLWTGIVPQGAKLSVSPDDDAIVAVASITEEVDFGGGPLTPAGDADAAIVVLEADGTHRWSAIFGDAAEQRFQDVEVGPDGVINLVGGFGGTLDLGGEPLVGEEDEGFVARLGADGSHLVSRTLVGGTLTSVFGLDGGFLVGRRVEGSLTLDEVTVDGVDGLDMALFAFDDEGAIAWHLPVVGPGDQNVQGVDVADDGDLYLLVRTTEPFLLGTLSIDGESIVRVSPAGEPLAVTPIPAGQWASFDRGDDGAFVLRDLDGLMMLDADLAEAWGIQLDTGEAILAPEGSLLVANSSTSGEATVRRLAR